MYNIHSYELSRLAIPTGQVHRVTLIIKVASYIE